jgi:queuine tRNA-ribosyltransferase
MFKLHDGVGRLGSFRTGSGVEVLTPSFVFASRSGFVPSLTSETLCQHVGEGDAIMVAVCVRDVADVGVSLLEGRGYAKFCGFDRTMATVVLPEDVFAPFAASKISKKRALVASAKGHSSISPAQYAALANAVQADLIAFPSNEPEFDGSVKSQEKSVNGTLQFMDACRPSLKDVAAKAMLGVIQGGAHAKLRTWSTEQIRDRSPFGFVLGGLSRCSDSAAVEAAVKGSFALLPRDKLRIVAGAWNLEQTKRMVEAGADFVVSSFPMDRASAGFAILDNNEETNVNLEEFKVDRKPIDGSCECFTCKNHTRGYIQHLLATKEMLATTLLTIHNAWKFQRMFKHLRQQMFNPAK